MSALTLKNVTYNYKNAAKPAVSGVDCTFEAGKLYAIVGPSGSGKSTLLSMLAGLDLPTDGEVNFSGDNLAALDLDRYRRESISIIFQAFHLFPLLTVMENVCYPMELCGVLPKDAKPRAAKLLESVGITKEQMKRFPSKLSGGEQQRVAIARALATGAKLLLADEPTGNLDVANTDNIMGILSRLAHDEGYCVIVVTHDLEVAEIADIVFGMKDGTLQRK
ncbi:MAG: ABC transporter ATP-binding protein [Oscillospiraceae bacterium]|nr:ABC transporter ATP-binding protein [Oscillospiraceae bacterium]